MSRYFAEHGERQIHDYEGIRNGDYGKDVQAANVRTKQEFTDSCDINKILRLAQKTGTISHMAKYGPEYGDFDEFDFHTAMLRIARGKEIFAELPIELKREFGNDMAAFFDAVNDPANKDRLEEFLPKLAEPGRQWLKAGPPDAPKGRAPEARPKVEEPKASPPAEDQQAAE